MSEVIDLTQNTDLQSIVDTIRGWLKADETWQTKFAEYATKIEKKRGDIKKIKQEFHKAKNLNLYTSISGIMANKGINLRYKGQSIAYLKEKNGELMLLSDAKMDKNNEKYFGWNNPLNCAWISPEATMFRKHFGQDLPKENNIEHLFESMLIEEFAKKSSKNKCLCNIQPVKMYNQLAFQMVTNMSASNKNKIRMSGSARAGGIDILARVGHGSNTNLCVIELKKNAFKSNEHAHIVRGQGLTYAVFLRELLRSANGQTWYEIFGFSHKVPEKLTIDVCIAAPQGKYEITEEPDEVKIDNDVIRFRYITFDTDKKIIKSIKSDLFA